MTYRYHKLISSILWNFFLITTGTGVMAIGIKAVIIPHGFITGGIAGLSLLCHYVLDKLSPGVLYLIINIPLFVVGWIYVSRRFLFYSLYGMAMLSVFIDLVSFQIPVTDHFLALLAGGCLVGLGAGITLHSLGSTGGLDIFAIVLNQKFSLRMGNFFLIFNSILFAFSFGFLETDRVLYSLALAFVSAQVLEYVLTMFNQRKMVLIISDLSDAITAQIHQRLARGATLLDGVGSYTGKHKKIIMTIVHNYQLKRLEETVFAVDPQAFMIMENTFNVYGKGFSRRKVY